MNRTADILTGLGGLPYLALGSPDDGQFHVYLHGAHVTSWIPAGGEERLFLSSTAHFQEGLPIRGGIPVCFPQFAGLGPLPSHGFARTQPWEVVSESQAPGQNTVQLRLTDSPATRDLWPYAFQAGLTVSAQGRELTVALAVRNRDHAPFCFTTALHTYLRVQDVAQSQIHGLAGVSYRDSTLGSQMAVQMEERLPILGEVNRIYFNAGPVTVLQPEGRTQITAQGLPDVVVWNPGPARGATMEDLEADGHGRMLCIEAAAIGAPITLQAGEMWTGSQTIAHHT